MTRAEAVIAGAPGHVWAHAWEQQNQLNSAAPTPLPSTQPLTKGMHTGEKVEMARQ